MNTFTKLASVTLIAVLLGTSLAAAGGIDGLNEAVAPTPSDSLQDAVQSQSTTDSINDAVQFDPERDINDAVLAGAKPGNGGRQVRQGGEILLALTCEAGGNERLTLRNIGAAVPAGTKVRWEVKSLGERGSVLLRSNLGNGDKVRVDVGMLVDAGTPCAARAI